MKKLILSFAALLMLPILASAQLGKTIPKIEFSIGGGAGAIGYIASIEKDSWYGQMNIADKDLPFGKHEDPPFGSASAGFYTDFHFTDHWGLSTGLEFAYYTFEYTFPGHVFSLNKTVIPDQPNGEMWIASQSELYESQQVYSLQIPIMGKFMVPISRAKGHQYYVAAGFKLGFHLLGQTYIEMYNARYQLLNRNTYSSQEINPDKKFAKPEPGYTTPYEENCFYSPFWKNIKYNPVDVLTSIDTGFRWNLGRGFGIYTGLFCDFGLLRPVALQEGKKIINYDPKEVSLMPEAVSFDAAEKVSIFAAEAPDLYVLGDNNKPEYIHNDKPYIKSLHKLTAGLKLRLSFGMLGSK